MGHIASIKEAERKATVVMADGTRFPADLVLLGMGVRPNTAPAEAADLTIGASDGIYYNRLIDGRSWLLLIYAKSARDNLPAHVLNAAREMLAGRFVGWTDAGGPKGARGSRLGFGCRPNRTCSVARWASFLGPTVMIGSLTPTHERPAILTGAQPKARGYRHPRGGA